jgi:hypothetical protein
LEGGTMAGKHEESARDPIVREALQLMERIAAHDHAIDAMEAELRALPGALAELAGHPVLWLLLGREGIDRPGGTWSAVVGQQVTTVRRRDPWLLVLVALFALLIGIGIGLGISWLGWVP